MVPGRIPLREEAALFSGVTKASAGPATGAIHSGPISLHPEGSSPQYLEFDTETSRLEYKNASIDSNIIPLRNNNNNSNNHLESLHLSAPSLSGDTTIRWRLTLADSGTDLTTNGFSDVDLSERQERMNEPTQKSDIIKLFYSDHSTLIDNSVSHSNLNLDEHNKNKIIS